MKKIKKPTLIYSRYDGRDWTPLEHVRDWFNYHVEPVNDALANGVEVTKFTNEPCSPATSDWVESKDIRGHMRGMTAVHKALLINIEPIKIKDTAEDVLRDFIVDWETNRGESPISLYDRAKKVLEDK
jgi:hypothetical protein